MKREEITALAVESGIVSVHAESGNTWQDSYAALERFATLVAEREREACAKLAAATICDTHTLTGIIYGSRVAKAIRDRSKPC